MKMNGSRHAILNLLFKRLQFCFVYEVIEILNFSVIFWSRLPMHRVEHHYMYYNANISIFLFIDIFGANLNNFGESNKYMIFGVITDALLYKTHDLYGCR